MNATATLPDATEMVDGFNVCFEYLTLLDNEADIHDVEGRLDWFVRRAFLESDILALFAANRVSATAVFHKARWKHIVKPFVDSSMLCVLEGEAAHHLKFTSATPLDLTVVVIEEGRIVVQVVAIEGNYVKLGFEADKSIVIDRREVHERKLWNK